MGRRICWGRSGQCRVSRFRRRQQRRHGDGYPWSANPPTPSDRNINGLYKSLVQSNTFPLAFPTRNDRTPIIQYADNLGTHWVSLPPVSGLGVEQALTQPLQPRRFFRVRE